ncbi:MAG TPA: TerC family protein [Candidatus Sulfopaludibacter sp.]|nr:TerC family protein [Candidatus Sulfopaludibacter sp.]
MDVAGPGGLMPGGKFFVSALSIVLIDLLLAGDNALVIAMAVRSLPRRERRLGTAAGAFFAVLLRVVLTYFAARLLSVRYIELAGGIFILWIAVKVLRDVCEPPEAAPSAKKLVQAIWYVVVADLTMSTDNILAIAGASHGDFWLIGFGLCVSIPFVVFSSNLLADLMNRYSWMVYIGAGILGKVGGDMIFADPFTQRLLHPSDTLRYCVDGVLVCALVIVGILLKRRTRES